MPVPKTSTAVTMFAMVAITRLLATVTVCSSIKDVSVIRATIKIDAPSSKKKIEKAAFNSEAAEKNFVALAAICIPMVVNFLKPDFLNFHIFK